MNLTKESLHSFSIPSIALLYSARAGFENAESPYIFSITWISLICDAMIAICQVVLSCCKNESLTIDDLPLDESMYSFAFFDIFSDFFSSLFLHVLNSFLLFLLLFSCFTTYALNLSSSSSNSLSCVLSVPPVLCLSYQNKMNTW